MIDSLVEQRITFAKSVPNVCNVIMLAIANTMQAWRIAKLQRRTAEQLSAFNDHMLKDIGVSRDMIYVAACRFAAADNEDRQA
ncbi:MAG: DUF1127 domain-containing protein [Gammaproteobacteria bacterium]|nr:DUF1127 domain-containing protein [Gammaproteobacteria bacterium]